jgi:hypothetical protein
MIFALQNRYHAVFAGFTAADEPLSTEHRDGGRQRMG